MSLPFLRVHGKESPALLPPLRVGARRDGVQVLPRHLEEAGQRLVPGDLVEAQQGVDELVQLLAGLLVLVVRNLLRNDARTQRDAQLLCRSGRGGCTSSAVASETKQRRTWIQKK